MALDKESPDKESAGPSRGGGSGGYGGDGKEARDKSRRDSTDKSAGRVAKNTPSTMGRSSDSFNRTGESLDRVDAPEKEAGFDAGKFATSTNQRLGYVETPTGAIPERPATINSFGKYTPGTGVFGAIGQYNDPNARMDTQGQLSQYGLIESELPSKWSKAGSLIGLGLGPGGSMLGGMAGTMADAAAAKSGLLDAGMNPDIAEKVVESTYGRKALGNLGGSLVGGPAAEFGYGLGGPEGAMAAASAAQAAVSAGAGALTGGEYNAADVAGLSNQTNKVAKSDSGDGPWFERVAQQLETPSQAVAGQPGKESIAPAIPTRLNYLEDSLANSAMQYASNANYQPRAVYSSGASSGASGTYYGNAPSSGTVINI